MRHSLAIIKFIIAQTDCNSWQNSFCLPPLVKLPYCLLKVMAHEELSYNTSTQRCSLQFEQGSTWASGSSYCPWNIHCIVYLFAFTWDISIFFFFLYPDTTQLSKSKSISYLPQRLPWSSQISSSRNFKAHTLLTALHLPTSSLYFFVHAKYLLANCCKLPEEGELLCSLFLESLIYSLIFFLPLG